MRRAPFPLEEVKLSAKGTIQGSYQMPQQLWTAGKKLKWRAAKAGAGVNARPSPWSSLRHVFVWDWPYCSTQGFANALQVFTLLLAVASFFWYFMPEQETKRLAERKAQLEEANAKLESSVNAKSAEIEGLAGQLDRSKGELAHIAKEKTLAIETAASAVKSATLARKSLAETEARVAVVELSLRTVRAEVVATRQEARRRLAHNLAPYLSECGLVDAEKFVECGTAKLQDLQFSSLFARDEMGSALAKLRVHGAKIETEWRMRKASIAKQVSELTASCNAILQAKERTECEGAVQLKRHSVMQSLDPFEATRWLRERLKPWANEIARDPGCPYFGKGMVLPQDWPPGCY